MWKYNTKDVLSGAGAGDNHLRVAALPSITGRPRDMPASEKRGPSPVTDPLRRYIVRVLFRRVSPAESKPYALARNMFALLAIFLIVFRAIVALAQANNKVETRLQSKPCNKPFIMYDTRILMTDMSGTIQHPDEVSTVNMTTADWGTQGCITTYLGLEQRVKPLSYGEPKFTRYNIFSCVSRLGHSDLPLSFDITVRSLSGSILAAHPLLWMLNKEDLDDSRKPSMASIMKGGAPAYIPAWQLRGGFHIEGEARIVKRGVIKSSVWRDLLINLDPQYAEIWLYQITSTSATRLANKTVASARLHISFDPSLNFLGAEKAVWNSEDGLLSTSPPVVCDIIEDYRSGTIMDVIGSVGGLFALLQAAHILLFGRPLLWGLTGAKLVTPFGLFGACSSQGFKRRLREQYHRQATDNNPDPIQIGAFLRDFVIDFGPASVDEVQSESRGTPERDPDSEEGDRNGSAGVHTPLMHVPSPISSDSNALAGENKISTAEV